MLAHARVGSSILDITSHNNNNQSEEAEYDTNTHRHFLKRDMKITMG